MNPSTIIARLNLISDDKQVFSNTMVYCNHELVDDTKEHSTHQELTNIDKWDLLNIGDESESNHPVLCLLNGDSWLDIIPAEAALYQTF